MATNTAGSCGSSALPLARRVIGIDSAKIATPSAPSSHPCVAGEIARVVGTVVAVVMGRSFRAALRGVAASLGAAPAQKQYIRRYSKLICIGRFANTAGAFRPLAR